MIRLAVRALILRNDRLLVVNAYPDEESDLWCVPGGGAEPHSSLPDNLVREVHEETGLQVRVLGVALINEFHAPERGFHQVDIFFRCSIDAAAIDDNWRDPAGVVSRRRWVTRSELARIHHKPDSLASVAWSDASAPIL